MELAVLTFAATFQYVQAFFVFTTFLAGKFGGSYVVTTLDG